MPVIDEIHTIFQQKQPADLTKNKLSLHSDFNTLITWFGSNDNLLLILRHNKTNESFIVHSFQLYCELCSIDCTVLFL